ncbi:hypothetical protein PVK06_003640 [Gossypium arboreum]|uniref:Uncharacterized protein n=1 Tax=Gossypium arboreum TaxID=29729 RepID=A0ABR0R6X1_GOSAR|nr:hypothetical protein PVK06_003640 [Gossypium arboreum]
MHTRCTTRGQLGELAILARKSGREFAVLACIHPRSSHGEDGELQHATRNDTHVQHVRGLLRVSVL